MKNDIDLKSHDFQTKKELEAFKAFAKKCKLDIDYNTIEKRDPPEPDILCSLSNKKKVAFELVEVLDEDLTRSIKDKILLEKALRQEFSDAFRQRDDILKSLENKAFLSSFLSPYTFPFFLLLPQQDIVIANICTGSLN